MKLAQCTGIIFFVKIVKFKAKNKNLYKQRCHNNDGLKVATTWHLIGVLNEQFNKRSAVSYYISVKLQ